MLFMGYPETVTPSHHPGSCVSSRDRFSTFLLASLRIIAFHVTFPHCAFPEAKCLKK